MISIRVQECLRGAFIAVVLVFAGIAAIPVPALAQAPLPADEIIDRAVERAERQREAGAELAFESRVESRVEHLGDDGQVERVEWETYTQYALDGVMFEERVAVEGEPLDQDEHRDEAERKEEFREEVRERREDGEDPGPEREDSVEFNREFVSRYRFSLAGEEVVDGFSCWVVYLAPRSDDLPVRRRIDNALNNSTGYLWISKDDFGVVRVEFEMARSVRFWGGILGTLRNAEGLLEFTRVAEDVWLPLTVDIRLDLRILFTSIRRRILREIDSHAQTALAD